MKGIALERNGGGEDAELEGKMGFTWFGGVLEDHPLSQDPGQFVPPRRVCEASRWPRMTMLKSSTNRNMTPSSIHNLMEG